LALFAAAIAVNMLLGRKPDCHCFGQLHSSPAGGATLTRNLILAGIAGIIVWRGPQVESPAAAVFSLGASEQVILVLALVVVAQAILAVVVLYHLLRQNGRMLQRLDAIEAKLGIVPGQPQAAGLPVDSPAPAFSVQDLAGATVTLDTLSRGGKPVLLFFGEPGCNACDAILPEIGTWQREHAEVLAIVPISRGAAEVNREKSATHKVQNILLQRDREVAKSYQVEETPSAVLLRDGRIASPLAVGPDSIRALVDDATLPPPLKKGDRVPALELRDLKGGTMDLAAIGGRPTMLLFWNPTCGFCQAMLDDVKAWESSRARMRPSWS
jgi:methylamine dehydrogenase accessory protein MauD